MAYSSTQGGGVSGKEDDDAGTRANGLLQCVSNDCFKGPINILLSIESEPGGRGTAGVPQPHPTPILTPHNPHRLQRGHTA